MIKVKDNGQVRYFTNKIFSVYIRMFKTRI